LDVKAFEQLLQEYKDGKATEHVRASKVPKNNLSQPVKIASAKNFKELVEDDDKDVMIEFYAPWCGHCKQLEPKYKQLGEKLSEKKNVIIAKLDATANDFDRHRYEVKGYPTIYFKPAGKSDVLLYEGPREVQPMYDWIADHGTTMKKKKNKKSKKSKKQKKEKKAKKEEDEQEDDDEDEE